MAVIEAHDMFELGFAQPTVTCNVIKLYKAQFKHIVSFYHGHLGLASEIAFATIPHVQQNTDH